MIHDPTMDITCDGCEDTIHFEPQYKYKSYDERSGFYDFSDDAIEAFIAHENWTTKEDQQFCEDCTEFKQD